MNDTISALRAQLQELKAMLDEGSLGAEAYAQAKAPLERQLVDRVMAERPPAAPEVAATAMATPATLAEPVAPRPGKGLVAGAAVAVLVLAVGGYSYTGSPGMTVVAPGAALSANSNPAPEGATPQSDAASAEDERQFAAVVETLHERMKEQPGNAEGWAMLARSYARLGRHGDAVPAFEKAAALAPADARLLADYADTLAMQNNGDLQGEPLKLLDRALTLEPQNPKALALAGTAAFDRKDFVVAVRYWENLREVLPADSPIRPQLLSSIDQARAAGGLPKSTTPDALAGAPAPTAATAAGAANSAVPPSSNPVAASNGPSVSNASVKGSVRLATTLAKQAAPTDTVFIYARAADGPRMPLAILRYQVKDLPISFTLDDSTAMAPALRLSLHQQVVVSARISKTGQAMPTAGDLLGQSAPVANTAQGVTIEINDVVKN